MIILSGRGARHGQRDTRSDDFLSSSAGEHSTKDTNGLIGQTADFGGLKYET